MQFRAQSAQKHFGNLSDKLLAGFLSSLTAMVGLVSAGMFLAPSGSAAHGPMALLTLLSVGLAGVLGLGAISVSLADKLTAPLLAAKVTVDEDAVTVSGSGREEKVPRSALREALLCPAIGSAPPRVDLHLRGQRTLSLQVADEATGRALVEALGTGAGQRRLTISGREPASEAGAGCATSFAGYIVAFIAMGLGTAPHGANDAGVSVAMAIGVAAGVAVMLARWSPRFVVGVDGLRVQGILGERFVSFADVTAATARSGAVELKRGDGSTTTLRTGSARAEVVQTLAERIQEALAARKGEREFDAASLAREGRSVADWKTALAKLLAPSTFRAASVPREELAKMLVDARATVEQRLAAALALTSSGDEEERSRVRVAAEAVADEHVRVALENVASGTADEATLERALASEPAAKSETSAS